MNEKKEIPDEREGVVLRVIGSPRNFNYPTPSKLLLWEKDLLTVVDEILASLSTVVVLTPSNVTATTTTISIVVIVLDFFSSRILSMAYAAAAALEYAGTRITGNTGGRKSFR